MKKNDFILFAIIAFIILLGLGGLKWNQSSLGNTHRTAVITQNGKLVERIDLDAVKKPREIILPGNFHETVLVEKGRIRFKQADCPDKICVNTGWLEEPGEVAVCLPNRAVVKIEN